MCGIIGYFGSTGSSLTRPLTAMSSIVYRAPDSSGIGFFGDDTESIRTRKAIGSVDRLIETLLEEEAYPNCARQLLTLWTPDAEKTPLRERQRRLLSLEGFSTEILDTFGKGGPDYPTFDQLLDPATTPPQRLSPGQPGRAEPLPVFVIHSESDFRELINDLIIHHDLPFLAIQTLIRRALTATLNQWLEAGTIAMDPTEILTTFDGLFSQTFWEECKLQLNRSECGRFSKRPLVEQTVWRLLFATPIQIPADYDRDGVCGLFRLLDAALLSRLPHSPGLHNELQAMLESFWPQAKQQKHQGMDWKTLYWAEKGVNVYGWAAASALAHLQRNEVLATLQNSSPAPSPMTNVKLGQTDPVSLHYLSPPIIAHGRWALHSAVTVTNAHPFVDATGQRSIVLNGQFSTKVEEEAADFLQRVAGYSFRSQNSTEYFALFWGYYAKLLQEEKHRFEAIRLQVEADLEGYSVGSQTIDYQTYHRIQDKSLRELDEMAFLQAAKRMIRDGGQLAAAGISLLSPRHLYVAAHNQPVFLVQRMNTDDFMVVSDVNAAMGLFPQSLIHQKSLELLNLRRDRLEAVQHLQQSTPGRETLLQTAKDFENKQAALLKAFQVVVYPLDGAEIFACIETDIENEKLLRKVRFSDFDGKRLDEVKSFQMTLDPLRPKKDLFKSFYESHLHEIPQRLTDLLAAYADDATKPPQLGLKDGVLHRHFGHGFVRLKRILLVGMGSAHNAGLMAREFLQRLLPELEVLVLRPIEVENVPDAVVPEKDLVVLLSWSSTTADMVHFAKALEAHRAVMLGITGKRFADMALITAKSAGVILALGGEEVTVAAVKSTFCLLFCLHLLGLWLRSRLNGTEKALSELEQLTRIPEILAQMLRDESLTEFSKELASRSRDSYACLIFDALESTAAGHEIASKLQENSWSAVGKRLDYHNLLIHGCKTDMNQDLVLVNATHEGRLSEALNVMKRLYLDKIPFAAVTYAHPKQADVRYYSHNLCLNLPKVEDSRQPFVDLLFHYLFAYHYGLAHGRSAEDAPRNRTKSVTVGRARFKKMFSRAKEVQLLAEKASRLIAETTVPLQSLSQETLWEQNASFERERLYYREMRHLTEQMSREDFARTFLQLSSKRLAELTKAIFQDLPEEGEIVFVSMDRNAHAAAKNVVVQWGRFLDYYLRVAPQGESLDHFQEDTVLIFVATELPEPMVLSRILARVRVPCVWLGPEIPRKSARLFRNSLGYFPFSKEFQEIDNELVYSGVSSLLLAACKQSDPDKAQILEQYFEHSSYVVQQILNDGPLQQSLQEAMTANRNYFSAFFCGPPGGTGLAWVDRFDQLECLPLENYLYGEGAHGPLVTVDPQVDKKFLALRNRAEMISMYGKEQVVEWEQRYLGNTGIDAFLERQEEDVFAQIIRPFFAEGQWYLPVLQPNYDAKEDNLIIIDATSERNFDRALDELATYGARYARLMVITQRAFLNPEERRALQDHPLSHLVVLPALGSPNNGMPIPGLLLPFAMNLLCMRLSAAATQVRNLSFEPLSLAAMYRENFGVLGEVMVQHGIHLGYLNHRVIDSIKNLAPVIAAVEGIGRYQVKKIQKEEQLLQLADKNQLHEPERTLDDFRAQQIRQTPFYLILPDQKTFDGRVFQLATPTFQKTEWKLWHEAYGDTWRVISSGDPDMGEISEEESLLMLPFAEDSQDDGQIYHLCLRCAEWDHQAPLDEQTRATVLALGKESAGQSPISARYREIVGYFSADTAAQHHSWDDRLLILVRRSLLFGKTSRESAKILVERVQKLLGMLEHYKRQAHGQEITKILEKVWPALQGTETFNDAQRWNTLQESVEDFL